MHRILRGSLERLECAAHAEDLLDHRPGCRRHPRHVLQELVRRLVRRGLGHGHLELLLLDGVRDVPLGDRDLLRVDLLLVGGLFLHLP
ncbi:hypothetical protein ABZ832_09285 [Streptantibioticus parmotrematis]|uniref:hypothetical protein n=1 Tax=Streptantibioticus parmotrematis TaxID=2873249 RepID=UPI0034119B24